jgi:Tfp pilus assembly protein PilN
MKTTDAKPVYGKTRDGVIHSEDGSVVHVKLKMKRGQWTVRSVDSWPLPNPLKTTLRLSGGASLGIRAEWRRSGMPDPALESPVSAANTDINPYLHPAGIDFALGDFSGNIKSLVTDDSFLLTLPLAFSAEPADSFLSVYYEKNIVTLGVVIARRLEAVFSFPCDDVSRAEASAARVSRYWSHILKRDDFPQKAFIWGNNTDAAMPGNPLSFTPLAAYLDETPLALPKELGGGNAMKAAGAALAAFYSPPVFKIPPRHFFRVRRPLLIKSSAILLCLLLIITSVLFFLNVHTNTKLTESEHIYNSRFSENNALQSLNSTANELAADIFSIKKAYTRSTGWGDLLSLLSEIRNDDLFLDRLGSENIQGAENSVRIALSGWARSETSVTEFVSGLQAADYIDNVSLASIERDAKNKNFCRFRIICTMQLFRD